jgi:HK97 family phage major capsid protein
MTTEVIELVTKAAGRIEAVEAKLQSQDNTLANINAAIIEIAQKGVTHPGAGLLHGRVGTIKAAIDGAMKSEAFRAFKEAKAISSGPMEIAVKALTSLQGNPASEPTGVDVTRVDLGVQTQVFKPIRVFETIPQRQVTTGNAIGFNKISFVSGTNDADYQDGEGEEKAEQDLIAQWIEAPIVTIAVHTTLSKQVLDDESQLTRAVENLLRYGLAEKVDRELLNGPGTARTIDGMVTQATPFVGSTSDSAPADRIGAAAASMSGQGYAPSVVYLNPQDWFAIASERTAEGEYVVAGWNTPAAPTIYTMRVVATPSITQGTALIVDPAVAEIGMRQSAEVTMSREHNGNLTKNLVTILAELRLALLVMDSGGLVTVDLE